MERMNQNYIKYVFWDFGDTLVELKSNILREFVEIIFHNCGHKIDVTDLKKAMQDEWNSRGESEEREKIKSVATAEMEHQYYAEFFKGTLRRLRIEDWTFPKLTAELATLKVTPSSYRDFPDALETVNKISKLGIKQAIISNGFHAAPEILKRSQLRDKFEFEIWSYRYNTVKPEQQIYKIALEQANCQAQDAIFIDDRKSFVQGAQKCGMLAIQIDRSQSTITELTGKNSFPIINNLSAVENFLQPKKPLGKSKNHKENVLIRNILKIVS